MTLKLASNEGAVASPMLKFEAKRKISTLGVTTKRILVVSAVQPNARLIFTSGAVSRRKFLYGKEALGMK